jgi:hypothetical protein
LPLFSAASRKTSKADTLRVRLYFRAMKRTQVDDTRVRKSTVRRLSRG